MLCEQLEENLHCGVWGFECRILTAQFSCLAHDTGIYKYVYSGLGNICETHVKRITAHILFPLLVLNVFVVLETGITA